MQVWQIQVIWNGGGTWLYSTTQPFWSEDGRLMWTPSQEALAAGKGADPLVINWAAAHYIGIREVTLEPPQPPAQPTQAQPTPPQRVVGVPRPSMEQAKAVMLALHMRPRTNFNTLTKLAQVHRPTVRAILERLMELGHVECEEAGNRHIYWLTDQGVAQIPEGLRARVGG